MRNRKTRAEGGPCQELTVRSCSGGIPTARDDPRSWGHSRYINKFFRTWLGLPGRSAKQADEFRRSGPHGENIPYSG